MGVLQTSKNQSLLVTDSTKAQDKGRAKGKEPKAYDSKPKESKKTPEGSLSSKKKKKFEKNMCPYCMRGFHLEDSCMKKQVDKLTALLQQNNIALPQGAKKSDDEPQTEDDERFHALKNSLTHSTTYLIDFGESNHMVSTKESFSTVTLSKGPSIHMGDDSQIPTLGIGSVKI